MTLWPKDDDVCRADQLTWKEIAFLAVIALLLIGSLVGVLVWWLR